MSYLLKNATIINEESRFVGDVFIKQGRIEKVGNNLTITENHEEINLEGKLLIPGCIDDQVHFREPGLTHKATIGSESRAAVAGGITSFMEMPNTVPNTLTQDLLQQKYDIASKSSFANYSFFMGASNDNIEEVLKTNPADVCGIKIFMGSSTGNMLVDNLDTLEGLFSRVSMLIATHCEDEATVKKNLELAKQKYGEEIPVHEHSIIRSEEACYLSSSQAVELARKNGTRLHILHISTERELELFDPIPLNKNKLVTAEACVHHMWFSDEDYLTKGTFIKWNPAVKKASDREAIINALTEDRIDVIATDHAPHTLEEKSQTYLNAPSGGPLVQHALLAMLDKVGEGKLSLELLVRKMCHNPAILFSIKDRGFIREGYFADLVVVDPSKTTTVDKDSLYYQCQWSPFEGHTFNNCIDSTFVNGIPVYRNGQMSDVKAGQRLLFSPR